MNFFSMVRLAKSDDLMMSKKHCHAKNVSSIVVRNDDGRLTRIFMAWDGHELHTNTLDGKMVVGIHNHKYNLRLTGLVGRVLNTTYQFKGAGEWLNMFSFWSAITHNEPPTLLGRMLTDVAEQRELNGTPLCLCSHEFHNIHCEGMAAWMVEEGRSHGGSTQLLTKQDSVSVEGLYESFDSPESVIEHVREFIDTARKRA